MLRVLRESPVTVSLCILWIALYALMSLDQGGLPGGSISTNTASRFGSLTVRQAVSQGEPWRTLTATFVHFNLLHLGINLFGLYQLGRLLESWYGGPQFLTVYVVIGVLGNAIAVGLKSLLLARFPDVAMFRDVTSGGGSTVLCGLIALLAVVGWRSRTRFGHVIKAEMIGVLLFTAFLGISIPVIDNFGHFGGAVAGAIVGFSHRALLRNYEQRVRLSRAWGLLASLVLVGAGYAQFQVHDSQKSAPRTPDVAVLKQSLTANLLAAQNLNLLSRYVQTLHSRYPGHGFQTSLYPVTPGLPEPPASSLRSGLRMTLNALIGLERRRGLPPSNPCATRLQELSLKVLETPLSLGETSEFSRCIKLLLGNHGQEITRAVLLIRQIESGQAVAGDLTKP